MLEYLFGLACCGGSTGNLSLIHLSSATHHHHSLNPRLSHLQANAHRAATLRGTPSSKHLSLTHHPCLLPGFQATDQMSPAHPTPHPTSLFTFPQLLHDLCVSTACRESFYLGLITQDRNHLFYACLPFKAESRELVLFRSPTSFIIISNTIY